MASFNKVFLMGNLTRDPELRTTPGGLTIGKFGLAVNRRYRTREGEQREEVTFVDIDAFGPQAETIHKYCSKGDGLFVEGRLKLDQWEDKVNKEKRSKLGVVLEGFQFTGGRGGAGVSEGSSSYGSNPSGDRQSESNADSTPAADSDSGNLNDDNIPF